MRENPYQGINAHFNSLLQTPGVRGQPSLWQAFHARHIVHIADAISLQLPSYYVALSEQSLQIADTDITGVEEIQYVKPDVNVFQIGDSPQTLTSTAVLTPTWEATLAEVLDPDGQPTSLVIRELLP